MTEQANPGDKGLRILLEALTTISYLKRDEARAAAIAEYALDQYENALRNAGTYEDVSDGPYLPGLHPEQRVCPPRRRADRRHANGELPVGLAERRLNADRRINPDRRCQVPTYR
jgi:hypothetical protein